MEGPALEFERPILDLERKIEELKQLLGGDETLSDEIDRLEAKATSLREETFATLTPWQVVQLSRHPARPYTVDYLDRLVTGFVELHGDRLYADDPAIVGGLGYFDRRPILVLGHQKGRNTKENLRRNFGMPRPEGYRKAKRLMELAARFSVPVLTLIDTPGAYPGIDAEERGQAEAIAHNLEVMAGLPVPIICVVIGEGGSGGALALGVADRILMLQYSVYSVISPEGCASILWKDGSRAEEAARVMQLRAEEICALKVADEVIPEPPGGAHRSPDQAAQNLGAVVQRHLAELRGLSPEVLLERRYQKFRHMGVFLER
ncbi:MAG: acetyl-CoA carboxylase carboxyltransferase subunit alpha [Deltaproteobacteria bacterium]|nr:acetyl-CoA carboxylase carboxyltransferase subunit alpha [Deltaproteobacteria bacterium]